MNLRPDPKFHATAKLAMQAPVETLAYTLLLSPHAAGPDGLAVVDVDPNGCGRHTYNRDGPRRRPHGMCDV